MPVAPALYSRISDLAPSDSPRFKLRMLDEARSLRQQGQFTRHPFFRTVTWHEIKDHAVWHKALEACDSAKVRPEYWGSPLVAGCHTNTSELSYRPRRNPSLQHLDYRVCSRTRIQYRESYIYAHRAQCPRKDGTYYRHQTLKSRATFKSIDIYCSQSFC